MTDWTKFVNQSYCDLIGRVQRFTVDRDNREVDVIVLLDVVLEFLKQVLSDSSLSDSRISVNEDIVRLPPIYDRLERICVRRDFFVPFFDLRRLVRQYKTTFSFDSSEAQRHTTVASEAIDAVPTEGNTPLFHLIRSYIISVINRGFE